MTSFWTDILRPVLDSNGRPVLDTLGHPVFGPPIPAPPLIDPDAVRPDVDMVAALSRTRTVDQGGADSGSFTESTHPSSAEVEELIDQSLVDVLAQLAPHAEQLWWPAISRAIGLRAAMTLETSFYREQAATSGPAAEWGRRYDADLQALRSLLPRACYVA